MRYLIILLLLVAQPLNAQGFSTQTAWDFACEYSQFDCEGLDMPTYAIGLPDWAKGFRGTYDQGIVYLNPKLLDGPDRQSTAIHETVHYLQDIVLGHPNMIFDGEPGMETLCHDEKEAFTVTDKYWRYIGQSDNTRGPEWWRSYSHCYPFYYPDWKQPLSLFNMPHSAKEL